MQLGQAASSFIDKKTKITQLHGSGYTIELTPISRRLSSDQRELRGISAEIQGLGGQIAGAICVAIQFVGEAGLIAKNSPPALVCLEDDDIKKLVPNVHAIYSPHDEAAFFSVPSLEKVAREDAIRTWFRNDYRFQTRSKRLLH